MESMKGARTTAQKQILFYSARQGCFRFFVEQLSKDEDTSFVTTSDTPVVTHKDTKIRLFHTEEAENALNLLKNTYINLLLLDFRWIEEGDFQDRMEKSFALLDALDQTKDLEARYGFHRIVALIPHLDNPDIDQLLVNLGAKGVMHVLRQKEEEFNNPERPFARKILDKALALIFDRCPGGRALCASGGGITGIYFELGALKAIEDSMTRPSLNEFDMFFGISAGAVVTAALAAGFSVDEFMAAVAGYEGGRIEPLSLRLFTLKHIDYPDMLRRFKRAFKHVWKNVWNTISDREGPGLDTFLFNYTDLVGAPFRALRFEHLLRSILEKPGSTNDFRQLPRPLYVGASDLDARKHILFGDEGYERIPISQAVQASISVNPAFTPVSIRGRYYEDGAITRTSNFAEAIRRDAKFVLVIDPFLPYVAREKGYATRRGILYNIDQDIRTITYTRFENTRNWILRKHPEVSSYTFVPANNLRKLMSINPMDHRPYLEIWKGAYLSTYKRLKVVKHRMQGDLGVYDLGLDFTKTEEVAKRLEATEQPSFADFFPDGKIKLHQPPLCLNAPKAEDICK